ncbi:hypothetical protein [Clostridium sp. AN503]|uniref:hypothetical protein n=1 Tax=Clostridium sp. AN503 TaxID=3160598 RepID=UPI0034576B98
MQKVIMIPEDRYNKMMKSYDEAMTELAELRKQLSELSGQTVDLSTDRGRGSTLQDR